MQGPATSGCVPALARSERRMCALLRRPPAQYNAFGRVAVLDARLASPGDRERVSILCICRQKQHFFVSSERPRFSLYFFQLLAVGTSSCCLAHVFFRCRDETEDAIYPIVPSHREIECSQTSPNLCLIELLIDGATKEN